MNNSCTETGNVTENHWKDAKRRVWWLGLVVPVIPFVCHGLVSATGSDLWWWFGPLFIFGIIPVVDVLLGKDQNNPPEELIEQLEQDKYYRWLTYLYIPFQYLSLIFACYVVSTQDLSWLSWLGFAISTGAVNGIAINTAHELGHKQKKLEKRLSLIALAPALYGHFLVEHNRGHHARVATPEDPASSRLGESFYQFLPRTVMGSFVSAWELESARLRRGGVSVFSIQNLLFCGWAISALLFGTLCLAFGIKVLPFLLVQAIYGASLLEVVNYLEHYGLLRSKLANNRYQKCEPEHSWNSNYVVSNLFLYQLQRHSDHHANPTRRYQSLRHFDVSPQLPGGYATMIPLAYIPPLWRWIMDKRVVSHYNGDVTKANIHPPARQRLLNRWPLDATHQ